MRNIHIQSKPVRYACFGLLLVFGLALCIWVIYWRRMYLLQWSVVPVIILAIAVFFGWRIHRVRAAFGEESVHWRGRIHAIVLRLAVFILFVPFSLYLLFTLPLAWGVGGLGAVLASLACTTAQLWKPKRGSGNVAKKFHIATVLFVVAALLIYLIDSMGGVDPNALDRGMKAVSRGVYFWLAAYSFYGGVILVIVGLVDFAFGFVGINGEAG